MTRVRTGLAGMIFASLFFFPASSSPQSWENANHPATSADAGSSERAALEYIRNRSSTDMDDPVSRQEWNF